MKWMKRIKQWAAFAPLLSALTFVCFAVVSLGDYEAAYYNMGAWNTETPEVLDTEEEQISEESVGVTEESSQEKEKSVTPEDAGEELSEISLADKADGIYEGVGTGFAGKIRVSVEVKNKKIISIKIISVEADGASFIEMAKAVIDRVLAAQSVKVDTVSGATYSSRGILRAVKNALTGESDDGQTSSAATGGAGSSVLLPSQDAGKYKDGVYEGVGTGFSGEIRVRVTIAQGKITAIEILSTADGAEYAQRASAVIGQIIEKQATDVDTVSGATYSSVGIISAVRDALSKAADNEDTEKEEQTGRKSGKFPYADGVYFGTAKGFSGEITVAAVIQQKTLMAVVVTETADDAAYMKRAEAMTEQMVKKQTTKIDTVSGATYSSKGIKKALKAALKEAQKGNGVKRPNSSTQSEETTPATGKIPYKEGVYLGSGSGFSGEIEVGLSIADQAIKAIVVTKTEDDEAFFNRARTVLDEVIKRQSADVDTVSGATFSSKGILEAVNDALLKAKRATEGNSDIQETDPPEEIPQDTEQPEEPKETVYQDGVYAVSVFCHPDEYEDFESYHLSASIEIKGDKIVAITDIAGDGKASNEPYIRRASSGAGKLPGVVEQILNKGDAQQIDAVSGATCTSGAIVDLCSQAFLKAKK